MGMLKAARRLWGLPVSEERQAARNAEYMEMVHTAWLQWQAAQNYFESVSDPDLIDYAIYDLEAARRRYVYMLRRADSEMSGERA